MNEPEIERLLKFFDLITYSGRMMKETPEEDPEFFESLNLMRCLVLE